MIVAHGPAAIKQAAAAVRNDTGPRGGLAAEARRQDASEAVAKGGWREKVLQTLEWVKEQTIANQAYGPVQADRGHRLIRDVEQQYPTHAHLPPDAPLPEPAHP